MTTLYTYIQTHYKDDPHTGDFYRHAPHQAPDGSSDLLSLACCAKVTRRVAEEDDWVMGLLSVNERPDDGRRKVSFLFRIDDIVARAKYYAHSKKRFDNYYRPNGKGGKGDFDLLPNKYHNLDTEEGREDVRKDMEEDNVLLSRTFHMFEPDTGCVLPPDFVKYRDIEKRFLLSGRNHRPEIVDEHPMLKLLNDLRNFRAKN
jgi:hypothetical protein